MSKIRSVSTENARLAVLGVYPNARAVFKDQNGRGWFIFDGPNVPGVYRSAGNAWRSALRYIQKTRPQEIKQ